MKWLSDVKKRRRRQNVKKFASLLTTPASGVVTLPANARLALSPRANVLADTTAASITGPSNRTIKTPAMNAGTLLVLDNVERGSVVTPAVGFDVMLDKGLSEWGKIGSS